MPLSGCGASRLLAAQMLTGESFGELMRRVRAGDQGAAAQLVREYEPELRREVRARLTDPKLRQVVDSMDICQSVLGNFFVRAALGQFDLVRPEDLVRLLVIMARNKVIDRHRREQARGIAVRIPIGALNQEPSETLPDPGAIVAGRDLLEEVRVRMTDEERELSDRRSRGQSWEDIGADLGENADTLRKRLTRAFDRIADQLGLES